MVCVSVLKFTLSFTMPFNTLTFNSKRKKYVLRSCNGRWYEESDNVDSPKGLKDWNDWFIYLVQGYDDDVAIAESTALYYSRVSDRRQLDIDEINLLSTPDPWTKDELEAELVHMSSLYMVGTYTTNHDDIMSHAEERLYTGKFKEWHKDPRFLFDVYVQMMIRNQEYLRDVGPPIVPPWRDLPVQPKTNRDQIMLLQNCDAHGINLCVQYDIVSTAAKKQITVLRLVRLLKQLPSDARTIILASCPYVQKELRFLDEALPAAMLVIRNDFRDKAAALLITTGRRANGTLLLHNDVSDCVARYTTPTLNVENPHRRRLREKREAAIAAGSVYLTLAERMAMAEEERADKTNKHTTDDEDEGGVK